MINFFNMKNVERFIRLDQIRILKLIEIIQYSSIAFTLGLFIGIFVNNRFPNLDKKKNKSLLFIEVILQMAVLIIIAYYIEKLSMIVPFCCGRFNKKYQASLHNENRIGITLGLAFIYSTTQTNLIKKINYLTEVIPF